MEIGTCTCRYTLPIKSEKNIFHEVRHTCKSSYVKTFIRYAGNILLFLLVFHIMRLLLHFVIFLKNIAVTVVYIN